MRRELFWMVRLEDPKWWPRTWSWWYELAQYLVDSDYLSLGDRFWPQREFLSRLVLLNCLALFCNVPSALDQWLEFST